MYTNTQAAFFHAAMVDLWGPGEAGWPAYDMFADANAMAELLGAIPSTPDAALETIVWTFPDGSKAIVDANGHGIEFAGGYTLAASSTI